MNYTMAEVVSQFKREWTKWLAKEAIEKLCSDLGYTWRERLLTPAITTQLMLLQVLHGNTAISHLPHLANKRFSPGAFCRARMRLPLVFFELLLYRITGLLQGEDYQKHTWCGHRIFVADGTGVSMPDTLKLADEFDYPPSQRVGAAFPVAKIGFMLHLGTGMIAKMLIEPYRSHDIKRVAEFHPELTEGDVFLADRAYCSYNHFCLILQGKMHALIRMHSRLVADFRPGRKYCAAGEVPDYLKQTRSRQIQLLGKKDQIVEWFKPERKAKSMSKEYYEALPCSIVVREVEYQLSEPGFRSRKIVVITTLLDSKKYTAKKIAELYGLRWEIETAFNHIKTTMGMDILKSKTPDGIKKELHTYCIVYNLIRLVVLQAAKKQKVKPKQISFVDALRWLIHAKPEQQLYALLLIPQRPTRFEPRARKRRQKSGYPFLLRPRYELRKKRLNPTTNSLSK